MPPAPTAQSRIRRTRSRAPSETRQRTKLRSATECPTNSPGPLAGLNLGLLHGRMSADDKEVTMARFKRGEIDVLVSTTVIEVGVDVPNATVMVIEHAERFGLAQMHQLRGRVGRGSAKSFCVLSPATRSPRKPKPVSTPWSAPNGFELAELDLPARPRRVLRHPASRPARVPRRQPGSRPRPARACQPGSRPLRRPPDPPCPPRNRRSLGPAEATMAAPLRPGRSLTSPRRRAPHHLH